MAETDDVVVGRPSACALYDLLNAVSHSESRPLAAAWSDVLAAEWNSLGFAQRHAEVVSLWADVVSQIGTLASEDTRARMTTYAYSWWAALIVPNVQWEGGSNPEIISQSNLDQLASLGDIISAQSSGTTIAPLGRDLSELRAQCEKWLLVLRDSEEITDESFRRTLQAQVEHLLWLIDNAHLFGVPRIIQHGDQLTGALIRVSNLPQGNIKDPQKFKKRVVALVVALGVIAGGVKSAETVIGAGEHGAKAIEHVVDDLMADHSKTDNNLGKPEK